MIKIKNAIKNRHSVKAYESGFEISDTKWEKILDILRFSPSSINIQPWHFIVSSSDEGKARIAKSAYGNFAYNAPSIQNASHVMVFCLRTDINEAYVDAIVAQEEKDGRYPNADMKAKRTEMMRNYVQSRRSEGRLSEWARNQLYINLGFLLMGLAEMDIDATPMEGIDTNMLDEEFDLASKGLSACFVVIVGQSDADADYNAKLPKSRLTLETIITEV